MEEFKKYLKLKKKSDTTINNYILAVNIYMKWLSESTNRKFKILLRENIVDYISFLRTIKKTKKGQPLRAKSINQYISGLVKFNEYLVEKGLQKDIVISSKDKIAVQQGGINPCKVKNQDVKEFRQKILESDCRSLNNFERIRNYCLVCIMEFCGVRVSEAINITLDDYNFNSMELIIRSGKGDKERIIYINTKIKNAIEKLLEVRPKKGNYLFNTRQSEKISKSAVEKIFSKNSDIVKCHQERHNWATTRLTPNNEYGTYSLAEVQYLLGHSSISSTQVYMNPSLKEMKDKAEIHK